MVGKKMGLETDNVSSLWKDRVLLEVNVAVLYSFQVSYLHSFYRAILGDLRYISDIRCNALRVKLNRDEIGTRIVRVRPMILLFHTYIVRLCQYLNGNFLIYFMYDYSELQMCSCK